MARPPLADLNELTRALGSNPDDADQATSLLERASAIVRAYAGQTWLNDAGDALEGVPDDIPGVVVGMVERATRNPGGTTQEAAGPFSRSFGADAAQRIYLTKMDKLVIRAAIGANGIHTISTSRGDLETAAVAGPTETYPEETYTGIVDLMGGS